MNAGKRMEAAWREGAVKVEDLYYQRMNDGTATFYGGQQDGVRFQQRNNYDCFMFRCGVLFLLELKSHKGKSLPLSAIREQQIRHLGSVDVEMVLPGLVCHFEDVGECWFLHGKDLKAFVDAGERKSIPVEYFREKGIQIAVRKKKVNYAYDVEEFTAEVIGEMWKELPWWAKLTAARTYGKDGEKD